MLRRAPGRLVALMITGIVLGGCGVRGQQTDQHQSVSVSATSTADALHAHPQAVEPAAGAIIGGSGSGAASAGADPPSVSVGSPSGSASGPLPQPVSDAQIRRELSASGLTARTGSATLTTQGLAIAPVDAPPAVQAMISAGNQIAKLPYRFGGGHGTFVDTAYDCSGSLSYVFASAGILNTTVVSGQLMSMGQAGPGKWVTIYANNGHTFMYVAGLRFDTVALAQTGSRWSNRPANEPDLNTFVIRHPPGL